MYALSGRVLEVEIAKPTQIAQLFLYSWIRISEEKSEYQISLFHYSPQGLVLPTSVQSKIHI